MDVLVCDADTEVGRSVAEAFGLAGHRVLTAPVERPDAADPLLDAIIHVPQPDPVGADPGGSDPAAVAAVWRDAFERSVVSAVVAAEVAGDRLRSGGSVVVVLPDPPGDHEGHTAVRAAVKAALSAWTADHATRLGTRGITVNAVACGRGPDPGYPGLPATPPSPAAEIARMAVFLTTPAARHITGQMLHVGGATGWSA
jgi:NAD(P)-dependent dehydrogenase (short-subunit alcohol dehydrogenase family)